MQCSRSAECRLPNRTLCLPYGGVLAILRTMWLCSVCEEDQRWTDFRWPMWSWRDPHQTVGISFEPRCDARLGYQWWENRSFPAEPSLVDKQVLLKISRIELKQTTTTINDNQNLQQTKLCVFCKNRTTAARCLYFHLELNADDTYFAWVSYEATHWKIWFCPRFRFTRTVTKDQTIYNS